MISLKDFMEVVGYRISEGSPFLWGCFGHNAYSLDVVRKVDDNFEGTVSITFDTETSEVYMVEAFDYVRNRAYRLLNPLHIDAYQNECSVRGIDDVAWESVRYVDLDVENDFLEKAKAIVDGNSYDNRVQLEVNFSDEELLEYMKVAHDMDITFNELVERALTEAINRTKVER